jgi:hypothetical protein
MHPDNLGGDNRLFVSQLLEQFMKFFARIDQVVQQTFCW